MKNIADTTDSLTTPWAVGGCMVSVCAKFITPSSPIYRRCVRRVAPV